MKVLVVDDDPVTRHLLKVRLEKWNYEAVLAVDGTEALQILDEKDFPRLVLLDWMMPMMSGLEVCARVREINREPYIYIIMLTARGRREDVARGLESGADDYIVKPFDAHELMGRLRVGERIVQLQEELINAREILRLQASRDSMTGLWNHSTAIDILSREISRSDRENREIGLIMGDLDNFKRVNDTHGHLVGDEVLQKISGLMGANVRPYDHVGRYGGEEFLVIVPGCDAGRTMVVAERLRKKIESSPVEVDGNSIRITMSLGVTSRKAGECKDPEKLINDADKALYIAKSRGKNLTEVFTAV